MKIFAKDFSLFIRFKGRVARVPKANTNNFISVVVGSGSPKIPLLHLQFRCSFLSYSS